MRTKRGRGRGRGKGKGKMKVSVISANQKSPNFSRRLRPEEKSEYTRSIQDGLKALDKELGIIVHNSTTPSRELENTGIGSLLSENARANFIPLLSENGFSKIQQEPDNLRRNWNPSPYSPLTNGKNIYMIPLEKLATGEYANILPLSVLNFIVENRPNKEDNKVDYNYVVDKYDRALNIAYTNFQRYSAENTDPTSPIGKLASEFEAHKLQNAEEEEPQAIFEILAREHKSDDWKTWNKTDRNLYNAKTEKQAKKADARLSEIREKYAREIDFYYFKQMIAEREIEAAKATNEESGIRILGDSPIAFTPVEEWQNQGIFLKDIALGCPPDYFSADGQRWGFAVIDPETIFNKDGSLGEGGKLMQKRYEKMFQSSSGGARIDHIIGLIDPFVYSTKEDKMTPENSGRLYSSPGHKMLGKYAKTTDEQYAAILTKIVIPAAEKFGLTKDDIICEDLGEVTEPVARVMKKLNLSGISVTQFDYRGKDTAPEKVIMLGSHDNPSFIEYTDNLFKAAEQDAASKEKLQEKAHKLAEDTIEDGEDIDDYEAEIASDKKSFMLASFVELFTSPAKRIQVFFTDFFGIGKTYNKPGETEDCWTLRMPDDIESEYEANLRDGKGFNLPEIIARAIRSKGKDFAQDNSELLKNLDKYSKILKE